MHGENLKLTSQFYNFIMLYTAT